VVAGAAAQAARAAVVDALAQRLPAAVAQVAAVGLRGLVAVAGAGRRGQRRAAGRPSAEQVTDRLGGAPRVTAPVLAF